MISSQKTKTAGMDDESDTGAAGPHCNRVPPARADACRVVAHSFPRLCFAVDAFIALGGRSDKGGEISTEKLRAVIKDFGLTIDIDVSAAVLAPARPPADAWSRT